MWEEEKGADVLVEYQSVRLMLEKLLAKVMEPNTEIKSSTLLQAYATFCAVFASEASVSDSDYDFFCKSSPYRRVVLGGLLRPLTESSFTAAKAFLDISPADFFRFVVPDLIADPFGLNCMLHEEFEGNLQLLIHHVIQLKLLSYSKPEDIEKFAADTIEDAVDRLYLAYKELKGDEKISKLSKEKFFTLYKLINLHKLDFSETSIPHVGYDSKRLIAAVEILTNELMLSREQEIDVLHQLYVKNRQATEIAQSCAAFNFSKVKNLSERESLMRKATDVLATVPPLNALCLTTLHKRTGRFSSAETYVKNDVPLENGLIYDLFTSRTLFASCEDQREFFIFFPSAFFVQKWISDSATDRKKVTFVFQSANVSQIIDYHYRKGTYAADLGKNVRFLGFDKWCEETTEHDFGVFLILASGVSNTIQETLYRTIKERFNGAEMFALLGSYEFEQAASPFSSELNDSCICIPTVEVIPQGINNSTSPRRKLFVQCSYNKAGAGAVDNPTKVIAYTLNTDLKTQSLAKMPVVPVECRQQDLVGLYKSIRELYNKELLYRKAAGRKRVAAFSQEFTPDIMLWCSKTYPESNKGRPRLEAYVCLPGDSERAEKGFRERGGVIPTTKKHTTKILNNDIGEWLEKEYPFSKLRPRHTKKELEAVEGGIYTLKPEIDIREEIIEHLGIYLEGENIALKTLWYLYPDLRHAYSARDYAALCQMACSEIGFLRVADITPEICEEILRDCYPDEAAEDLLRRFDIISVALDRAVKHGYCEKNRLAPVLQEKARADKLFAQVRRAMVKKHFEESELLAIYTATSKRIEEGELEYLGVMIRLLTGLENNIVCALKWKDIRYLADYDFRQIVVTRQVSNDGKTVRGFDSLEDYRCIPSSVILWRFLAKQQSRVQDVLHEWEDIGEFPIVSTREAVNKKRSALFAPQMLAKKCREIVASVGIDDHVVELPDAEGGWKETDLNRYGGDIFRENFRHWAVAEAKMIPDEVLYCLGNKPATTFGTFYCDFLNEGSQYKLFCKLLRLDAIFESKSGYTRKYRSPVLTEYEQTFSASSGRPLQLHIQMHREEVPKRDLFSVCGDSPLGLRGEVSPVLQDESLEEV